jgi:uncharacterized membrane protein
MADRLDRTGVAATVGAFVVWGLFPLYWRLLAQVPSMQIIAHRIVWSALLVAGWLGATQGLRWWRALAARPRVLPTLALTSVLIAFNWGLYIWAVNAGHVVESSLGYFINPLVNVLLGVLVLKERLRPLQWLAVACAALGVAWLTWQAGRAPWIALGLAASFGLYGLFRKLVAVDAWPGSARRACSCSCRRWRFWAGARPVTAAARAGRARRLASRRGSAAGAWRRGHRLAADRFRLRRAPHSVVAGGPVPVHRADAAVPDRRAGVPRVLRRRACCGFCRDLGRVAVVRRRGRMARAPRRLIPPRHRSGAGR